MLSRRLIYLVVIAAISCFVAYVYLSDILDESATNNSAISPVSNDIHSQHESQNSGRSLTLPFTRRYSAVGKIKANVTELVDPSDYKTIHILPRPKNITILESNDDSKCVALLSIDKNFALHVASVVDNIDLDSVTLEFLFSRFHAQTRFQETAESAAEVTYVSDISITFTNSEHIQGYTLIINKLSMHLNVSSIDGLRHGLQTISLALLQPHPVELPMLINDFPSHKMRGLLVDVARHFIPIRKLYRMVDSMMLMKFNYLHLHLTDSQVSSELFLQRN
jgi:hypothetical protein